MSEEKKIGFEERLNRLGEIVRKVETETLPLETSIALYQEGLNLIKTLEKELKDAEEKIGKVQEIEGEEK